MVLVKAAMTGTWASGERWLLPICMSKETDIFFGSLLTQADNGHTGTDFERPGVQEMLELVRCGGVNCIVVKDFSRFSRNALESGYYIEQVFPLFGVRFISVGDYFDSDDYKDSTGGLDVAFKFLVNEHYSKDLSKKPKSPKLIGVRVF